MTQNNSIPVLFEHGSNKHTDKVHNIVKFDTDIFMNYAHFVLTSDKGEVLEGEFLFFRDGQLVLIQSDNF